MNILNGMICINYLSVLFSKQYIRVARWPFIHVLQCHCSVAPREGALRKAVLKSQHLETRLGAHGFPTQRTLCVCVFFSK